MDSPSSAANNNYFGEVPTKSGVIRVEPRWPYRSVFISEAAYRGLVHTQENLKDHEISLVITRGLENSGLILRILHRIARCSGSLFFKALYPRRWNEVVEIFSTNGHDVSANCIDLAIFHEGNRIKLLPYGVFTPPTLISRTYALNQQTLEKVWSELRSNGFSIHINKVESMQIHCEFIETQPGESARIFSFQRQ